MRSNLSIRTVLNYVVWIAVIGLALNLGITQLARTHAQALTGAVVPYTVTLEQTFTGSDGSGPYGSGPGLTITWAVRSDGSRGTRIVSHGGKPMVERVLYFASGTQMYIFDSTGRKSTTFDASKTPVLRDPKASCLVPGQTKETVAGEEMIDGYRAVKLTDRNVTAWYALDYGCALVKNRADWGSKGYNETHLVKLIPGEPASELFADPQDYQEVLPSGLFGDRVKAGDPYYQAHRPQ